MVRCFLSAVAALALLAPAARAHSDFLKAATTGDPQVKSIEALTFSPDGLLVIGDGKGAQVVVVDTTHAKGTAWERTEIKDLAKELAGRVGAAANGVTIKKVAVHPKSKTAYLAVNVKATKKDVLLTVDGSGKISEFVLDKVSHMRVPLNSTGSAITLVSDVAWAKDRILVAAQANETFGSKIVSIPLPLDKDTKALVFSTETYHVGHGKWETKAPIRTLIPYEENGKQYVVGSFTCTPIVKYALEDLKPGAKVKGVSVIELGTGNTPQDMFVYTKNDKMSILVNTNRSFGAKIGPSQFWTARVDYDILQEADKVNEKAQWRVGTGGGRFVEPKRAEVVSTFSGVTTMDRLDNDRALAVRTDDKGNYSLVVLALP